MGDTRRDDTKAGYTERGATLRARHDDTSKAKRKPRQSRLAHDATH
jgi:hypothetical protein